MSAAPHFDYGQPAEPTRVPPHSLDAEVAVISACLEDKNALMPAIAIIDADAFYGDRHRKIFAAMIALAERGVMLDPITISNHLANRGELEASGGKEYLGEMVGAIPTTANVVYHATIIREKADLRKLIERSNVALQAAFEGRFSAATIAAELQRDVLPFATDQRQGFVRIKEDIWAVMEELEAVAGGATSHRVVPTGYTEIDSNIAGGFERGHFIVLAGVPGSAKTGAALNLALNIAGAEQPQGVLFVSAEMSRRQLIHRSLANIAHVPLSSIRRGAQLEDGETTRMAKAVGHLASLPFWVDQTPTPDIHAVVAKCRQKKAEHPEIALLVVDFIQLVQKQHERNRTSDGNRSAELTHISYTLAGLGKELDCAVLATSQVDGAAIEKRPEKRPTLGDARWSQGMREAANLFATVYRQAMYDSSAPDTIELAFQKGRDDPPFTATFDWVGKHMAMRSRIGFEKTRVRQESLV